ncbi:single-stranded DNA-binding protein [Microdochium nivale]|nr:single-stranded DNA-binding protein [Microdochium nivale]
MSRKILIIAGAPEARSLNWEQNGLLDHLVAPFTGLASFQPSNNTSHDRQEDEPVWRSIPLRQVRLPTGFSQTHNLHEAYQPDADFISTVGVSFADVTELSLASQKGDNGFLQQLYEHSILPHDASRASELDTQSFSTTASSIPGSQDISTEYSVQPSGTNQVTPSVGCVGHLSDLEDIPKATYLDSIAPQTMTVNLIVGIISIAEPRTVRTRWGATKSLVEMLLGDDTKSGFSVTFWLSHEKRVSPNPRSMSTETALKDLRRQDVVLLRNVALGSFSKKVHGHSLHNGMTKVHLLHRRKLDKTDTCGVYAARDMSSKRSAHPQLVKTRRVWEWTINFVGGSEQRLGKRKTRGRPVRSWEMPPPDTQ